MLTKKEAAILSYLLKNKYRFISSFELAEAVEISDRTVRKYLKLLAEKIEQYGATLISKQGQGYLLEITEAIKFDAFWQEAQLAKKTMSNIVQVEESIDRQHYILNKLFFNNTSLLFEDLMQELYVSKTTLVNALNNIRQKILPYSLTIVNDKKGIRIQGAESDIRHFMMDYFFVDTFQESVFSFIGQIFQDEINFAELSIIVIDECRDAELILSDYVVHNLVLHIALMIKRTWMGHTLSSFKAVNMLKESKEYEVASKILKRLEWIFNVKFPNEEASYIALHIKVKQTQILLETHSNQKDELMDELKITLEKIDTIKNMDLANDSILLNNLYNHLQPLLTRLENDIQLSNPLVDDIKQQYPEILDLTITYFSEMSLLNMQKLGDDEWAYIAIHILAAIEREINRAKLKVLVVCATGTGSAMMLRTRLENEFGGTIKIVDVIGYYALDEARVQGVDLIISSISLSNLLFLTPVIQVSIFLTTEEIEEIRKFIRQRATQTITAMPQQLKNKVHEEQELLDIFNTKQFLYIEESVTKEELLEMMVELLSEAHKSGFKQLMLNEIELRETYGQVVYGEKVAFPHPTHPLTIVEEVVVAIIKEPISWDGKYKNVHFVFLISPSKTHNQKIKYVSSLLAKFVDHEEKQKQLMEEPCVDTLKKIFMNL